MTFEKGEGKLFDFENNQISSSLKPGGYFADATEEIQLLPPVVSMILWSTNEVKSWTSLQPPTDEVY